MLGDENCLLASVHEAFNFELFRWNALVSTESKNLRIWTLETLKDFYNKAATEDERTTLEQRIKNANLNDNLKGASSSYHITQRPRCTQSLKPVDKVETYLQYMCLFMTT